MELMKSHMRRVALSAMALVVLALLTAIASAQTPPASCVNKYIGEWSYSGGTTTINPDGTANPHCFFCVRVQSWTCNGDTYLFSNSGPPGQFSATLIDPNHMQNSNGILNTRVGAPPPQDACDAAKKQAAQTLLSNAKVAEAGFREERKFNNWSIADGDYEEAADQFGKCGDSDDQNRALALRDNLRQAILGWPPARWGADPSQCDAATEQKAQSSFVTAQSAAMAFAFEKTYDNWSIADADYAQAAQLVSACDPSNHRRVIEEQTRLRVAYNDSKKGKPPPRDKPTQAFCDQLLKKYKNVSKDDLDKIMAAAQCNPDGTPM